MKKIMDELERIVIKASELFINCDSITIETKDTKDNFVTNVDLAIQKYLNQQLSLLIPGSSIYGEENDEVKFNDYTWIVDPIDGTNNFMRTIPHYAISIALMVEGDIILGLVYNPMTKELFKAIKGEGSFLNNDKIEVSNSTFEESLFCTSLSVYNKKLMQKCLNIMTETYLQCVDIRRFGSCALELCYLASGRVDLYFEAQVYPWDYGAASLILLEAGGVIGTTFDQRLEHNKAVPLIAANNKKNYEKLKIIVDKNFGGSINEREKNI